MRAFSAAICASNWSIRTSSDATIWASSVRGESIFLCGMASLKSARRTRLNTSDPSHNAAEG